MKQWQGLTIQQRQGGLIPHQILPIPHLDPPNHCTPPQLLLINTTAGPRVSTTTALQSLWTPLDAVLVERPLLWPGQKIICFVYWLTLQKWTKTILESFRMSQNYGRWDIIQLKKLHRWAPVLHSQFYSSDLTQHLSHIPTHKLWEDLGGRR